MSQYPTLVTESKTTRQRLTLQRQVLGFLAKDSKSQNVLTEQSRAHANKTSESLHEETESLHREQEDTKDAQTNLLKGKLIIKSPEQKQ